VEQSGDNGPHEANFLKLDCSKAKAVLGWKPRWDIKTAVKKVVEFAKAASDEERLACVESQIKKYFQTETATGHVFERGELR
jgi:CDP-glucose 4,6-dehydratase